MHTTENIDITEKWDHPIDIRPNTDLYKLLLVSRRENSRINLEIEELYDNRFLSSATGNELGKLGKYVGVQRKTDEPDKKLRKRIQAEFLAQGSDTTYRYFATASLEILEAPKEAVNMITPPESPSKVITLEVEGKIFDENPLTVSEIADLLDKCVSADAKVNLIDAGTFAFAGDDDSLEGWDVGTWSTDVEE